jgi:uncharacterized PurR-regulated membrane protein YhhQ (DUF165 family)
LANWLIGHVGVQNFPGGPHTIPVAPGLQAPSGVLAIGFALVARDVVQRQLGRWAAIAAIACGAALSYLVAPSLAFASAAAFLLGELADFAVYAPLEQRNLYWAVALSGVVGAVFDSLIFLQLAFHSTRYWQGNVLGKVWMTIAALPLLLAYRRAVSNPDESRRDVCPSSG